jgi:large subunit ribosomal protein L18
MINLSTAKQLRLKRVVRIRVNLKGTAKRPRVTVFRSNTSLMAQFIDDESNKVIMSRKVDGKNMEAAKKLGTQITEDAKAKKIDAVVFDRSGYKYHGTIKAIAEALREGGLKL